MNSLYVQNADWKYTLSLSASFLIHMLILMALSTIQLEDTEVLEEQKISVGIKIVAAKKVVPKKTVRPAVKKHDIIRPSQKKLILQKNNNPETPKVEVPPVGIVGDTKGVYLPRVPDIDSFDLPAPKTLKEVEASTPRVVDNILTAKPFLLNQNKEPIVAPISSVSPNLETEDPLLEVEQLDFVGAGDPYFVDDPNIAIENIPEPNMESFEETGSVDKKGENLLEDSFTTREHDPTSVEEDLFKKIKFREVEDLYLNKIQESIRDKMYAPVKFDSNIFVEIKLIIEISGEVSSYLLLKSSGVEAFDITAINAVKAVILDPLPEQLRQDPPYIVRIRMSP